MGGRGFGALRAQGQPGPSSGEPLCTSVSGPALPAQHEWGQSEPSEAHFQGRLGALAQSLVPPQLGCRGRVFPQREVEKYSAGGPGNSPEGPGLPRRQDFSIGQHCSPTPAVSEASGRGALRANGPPGGTAEAGGKGLSRVYHQGPYPAPSQAHADAEGSVHPGLPT